MRTFIIPSLILATVLLGSAYLISSAIKQHAKAIENQKSIIVGFDPLTRAFLTRQDGFKINLNGNIGVDANTRYPLKFENATEQK
jgi:hypothetical protein